MILYSVIVSFKYLVRQYEEHDVTTKYNFSVAMIKVRHSNQNSVIELNNNSGWYQRPIFKVYRKIYRTSILGEGFVFNMLSV